MPITSSQVRKVAQLARLELTEDEVQLVSDQLASIVTFVDQLGEVATDGVEPMAHPLDIHTVVRPDTEVPGLSREQALSNSPNHNDECFLVPPVMAR